MPRDTDSADRMWVHALGLMAQAERLHQQFFRLAPAPRQHATWEPPADVFESEHEVAVVVALPGVSDEHVRVLLEPGALHVQAERALPFAGPQSAVRQLEIPYGRFERRIPLPPGRWEDGTRELTHGCLVVRLHRAALGKRMNDLTPLPNDPVSADAGRGENAPASAPGARGAAPARALPEDALIILPVRNVVLFPGIVMPLAVGPRALARRRAGGGAPAAPASASCCRATPDVEEPGADDLHWVGTTANVLRYITAPDGAHHADLPGPAALPRAPVPRGLSVPGRARPAASTRPARDDPEIEGRARALKQRAAEVLELLPQVPEEVVTARGRSRAPSQLADFIAGLIDIAAEEKQALLETLRPQGAPRQAARAPRRTASRCSRSRARSSERTRESIDDANRKHLLREQMRPIQKELGEDDESAAEIDELDEGRSTRRRCPRRSRSTRARS